MLLEGDEYPSSNTDNRSKFLHYRPAHLLLTPLAHDHVNVFPTVESYLAPFSQLVDLVPEKGLVLASTSGELSARFLASVKRPVITYGIENGDWQVRDIAWGERTQFTIVRDGRDIVRCETGQLGLHNIENMLGVGPCRSRWALFLQGASRAPWRRSRASGVGLTESQTRRESRCSKASVRLTRKR